MIEHPLKLELSRLFGVIFTGPPHDPKNFSRNVNVFESGDIDCNETGMGISARIGLHFARGLITFGERFTVESIVGSTLTSKVLKRYILEGL